MKIIIKSWKFDYKDMEEFNKTYEMLLKKLDTQERIKVKIGDLEGEGLITQINWENKEKIKTLEIILE